MTWRSCPFTSRPIAAPTLFAIVGFHAAAIQIPEGKAVDFSHRTPSGPSVIRNSGIPNRSMGFVANPVPLIRWIFSSRVIRLKRSSTRTSRAIFLFRYFSCCEIPNEERMKRMNAADRNKRFFMMRYSSRNIYFGYLLFLPCVEMIRSWPGNHHTVYTIIFEGIHHSNVTSV